MKITKTTQNQVKKEGTKTVWINTEKETTEVTETFYNNFISATKAFRRAGASVSQTKFYTCRGYKVVQDVNTSPDKTQRVITNFHFA